MKHLKRFSYLNESNNGNCKRCNNSNWSTWSFFNDDQICAECAEYEKNDPDYADCREAEAEAIRNGDNNYHYLPNYEPIVRKV